MKNLRSMSKNERQENVNCENGALVCDINSNSEPGPSHCKQAKLSKLSIRSNLIWELWNTIYQTGSDFDLIWQCPYMHDSEYTYCNNYEYD